jgi:hypothetical protein
MGHYVVVDCSPAVVGESYSRKRLETYIVAISSASE